MECMDLGSLETMITVERTLCQDRAKPLIPELVIARFAWHILQGLNYLHSERK